MTTTERVVINERIDAMVGSREENERKFSTLDIGERIKAREKYNNLRDKLMKIAEKNGEKALTLTIVDCGKESRGVTASGKKFIWIQNQGMETRSRYCGSLYIENIGTVFTSGTVAKVFEYVLNN